MWLLNMLFIIRLVSGLGFLFLLSIPGFFLCLLRPFHPNLVYWISRPISWLCPWFGIQVEVKGMETLKEMGPCVLICNHQHTMDLSICPHAFPKGAVTLGKKSLKWVPVFGLFYWISGNLMIDRNHSERAAQTIEKATRRIRKEQLKVWIFPEGTRSFHRGLQRFKTGAFRLAQQANVPVVPVCVADIRNLDLNRWSNGKVAIEFMKPVTIAPNANPRVIADEIQQQMAATIARLSQQTEQINES